jgi:MFS family permease
METREVERASAPSPEVSTVAAPSDDVSAEGARSSDGAAALGAGGSAGGGTPAEALSSADERRNHRLHILEGAALMGAFGAINGSTVGTSLVESLGGNAWLVAFVPMASTLGFSLGPILSAHRLDGQRHFLPVLRQTLPLSRVPILLIAVMLWGWGNGPFSAWAVVSSYVVYGIIGGLGVGAWQQLILRTVRPDQRPSLFATRYLASNAVGLGVAAVVGPVLARWPGTHGYALLHLIAFTGAILSYRLLMAVREPSTVSSPPVERRSFLQNLRGVPELFAADRRLSGYLWAVVLVNSQYLVMGFLALHALRTLHEAPSYVGTLTTAQMLGAVVGTFVAARFGNRCGSRTLLVAARLLFLGVALGALFSSHDYAFRALFAMYGAATWVNLVGHNTMTLELLPSARRSTVLAVFSLVQVPSMLVAAELGAWLWQAGVSFYWIAALGALGMAGSLFCLLPSSPVLARQQS